MSGLNSDPAHGLRERSKARRRRLIRKTALELFAANGYDATTITEIANAAEVAPRTVTGYFPSKLDLATSFADETAQRLTATFNDHPDQTPLQNIEAWLKDETQDIDTELALLTHDVFARNPELAAASSARMAHATQAGTAALGRHLGLDADHPMVHMATAAVGATLGTYVTFAAEHGPSEQLFRSTITFLEGLFQALPPPAS